MICQETARAVILRLVKKAWESFNAAHCYDHIQQAMTEDFAILYLLSQLVSVNSGDYGEVGDETRTCILDCLRSEVGL
jgi:hypothetical protein